ncbi:MAG: enoyl-CoA hydratase-related protein [Pseudomonadota bacterium]
MDTIQVTTENFIQTIMLDRPDALNAFNSVMFDELAQAFIDAAKDDTVRVVVLSGKGRAFSAGADLTEMGKSLAPPKYGLQGLLDTIIDFPKPFMLAVNGLGVGIGATICGLADLVYMGESARLRCPFSALGLTAEAASTQTFPKLMGRQQANWMLLSAEWMDSQACLEAGLALEVITDDGLMDRAMARARTLADLPLSSLMTTKDLMMGPIRDELKAATREENKRLATMKNGPANLEALTAFKEKRQPDFSKIN